MNTRRNLIANVGGRIWQAAMNFAFVPLYIRFLGVEAYGLIGVFATLLALFAVLELGASTTINRELGRMSEDDGRPEARTLLRTFEWLFWLIGVVVTLVVFSNAGYLARGWLNVDALSHAEVSAAIQLMAGALFLRWPAILYTGALMGLRRHVTLNVITALGATLQGLGAVIVLWRVSSTPTAFFAWQIAAAAFQLALLIFFTWRNLRLPGHKAHFQIASLQAVVAFSAAVMGINLLSTILMQLDRVMLSSMVSLETFGYYTLASSIAAIFSVVGVAVFGVALPSFSLLVREDRSEQLPRTYHKYCEVVSLLLVPASATVIFFSPELLAFYVHSENIVSSTYLILSILVLANLFNAMMLMPVALQYAFGWTRIALVMNAFMILIFMPILWLAIGRYGAVGAAMTWLSVCVTSVFIMVSVMHTRLVTKEKWRWYLIDIGLPLAISFSVTGLFRSQLTAGEPTIAHLAVIAAAFAVAFSATAVALPWVRGEILATVVKMKGPRHA